MLLYVPSVLLPFHDGRDRRGVVVDGLSGRAGSILSRSELERIEALARPLVEEDATAVATAGSDAPQTTQHRRGGTGPLLPLVCPECSAPMPLLPRARTHCCPICLRLWTVGSRGLRAEPTRILRPQAPKRNERGAGDDRTWLPFYRLRGADESLVVPAFHGRHPRAIWNFIVSLNRLQPAWQDEEGEPIRPGAVVEHLGVTALALSPFLCYCLERERPFAPAAAELIWVEFAARGPDWVEPGIGLGFPRAAVTPWSPPAPRPQAARTG
jgi:hypothetical protein